MVPFAVRISNMEAYLNTVFGADDILEAFPTLNTPGGVDVLNVNDFFYILDDDGNIVSDSMFFALDELQRSLEIC